MKKKTSKLYTGNAKVFLLYLVVTAITGMAAIQVGRVALILFGATPV